MDDSAANSLAIVIRPLFREVASTLELPDGILGLVLAPPNTTLEHIYFAEFVGTTYSPSAIDEAGLKASHYQLPVHNILSNRLLFDVLSSDGELRPTHLKMPEVQWSRLEDVYQPLQALFGEHLPENVLLHRVWLKQPLSMLYYIPKDQDTPEQWKALVRTIRFVACLLRMSMVIVSAADLVDAVNVHPLIDCLPTLFADHEMRLAKVVADGVDLKARTLSDWASLKCSIEYYSSRNQLVFSAETPGGTNTELVTLNCTRGALFSGKSGARLIECPGKHRDLRQTLAYFMFRRAQRLDRQVHYREAYEFFCPVASGATRKQTADDVAPFGPRGVESGTDRNNKDVRGLIQKRVVHAEAHLRQLMKITEPIKYFRRNKATGTYSFGPEVAKGELFKSALETALSEPGEQGTSFFRDMAMCCNSLAHNYED